MADVTGNKSNSRANKTHASGRDPNKTGMSKKT